MRDRYITALTTVKWNALGPQPVVSECRLITGQKVRALKNS